MNKIKLNMDSTNIKSSPLFSIKANNIYNTVEISVSVKDHLPLFIKSISSIHVLAMSRTATPTTFKSLVVLSFAFLTMHDSSIMRQLFVKSTFLSVPRFIISPLLRVAISSLTKNKISGFTSGDLHNTTTLRNLINEFLSLDVEDFKAMFSSSEFLQLGDTAKKLYHLKADVLEILFSLGIEQNFDFDLNKHRQIGKSMPSGQESAPTTSADSDSDLVEYPDLTDCFDLLYRFDITIFIQKSFYLFPHVFKYNKDVNYFTDSIQLEKLADLSVYRFRNTDCEFTYVAQQASISALSPETLDLFASFLAIFRPRFNASGTVISGDLTLSVEETPIEQAWLTYFGFSVSEVLKRNPKDTKRKPKSKLRAKGSPLANAVQENLNNDAPAAPGAQAYSTISQTAGGKFFGYHRNGLKVFTLTYTSSNLVPLRYSITRSFRSTSVVGVDPVTCAASIVGKMSVSPSPIVLYPDVPISGVLGGFVSSAKFAFAEVCKPYAWQFGGYAFLAVSLGSLVYYGSASYAEAKTFVTEFIQLSDASSLAHVVELNLKYPSLSSFNENAAILLHQKLKFWLSLSDCQLLIKHYISGNIPKIYGILLDTTNLQHIQINNMYNPVDLVVNNNPPVA